jgi:hypothetical protein
MADILRNGPIAVSAVDNYLYFTLPITMSLSHGKVKTPAIPLKLKFRAIASITPDWKLNAEFYYMGLSDLLADEIAIGPLSIKPRSILEGIIQPMQHSLSELINTKIVDKFPLKARVAKIWNAAQKPILLNRNYKTWLQLTPREIMISPLHVHNDRVKLNVGISSFAELVVGREPAARPVLPLPDLKPVNIVDESFRIALNVDLYYRDILSITSPLLLNKEFHSGGKTIVLKGLDLYGKGDELVIKAETKGSLDGVFYLTGKPRFDPRTNIFSVEDVDFDMKSRSLLLQSADWFLHSKIKGRIQEKLHIDLTRRLEQSSEMARKGIARVRLADHVLLKGNIKALHFSELLVQKDKISIQIFTEGESAIVFE